MGRPRDPVLLAYLAFVATMPFAVPAVAVGGTFVQVSDVFLAVAYGGTVLRAVRTRSPAPAAPLLAGALYLGVLLASLVAADSVVPSRLLKLSANASLVLLPWLTVRTLDGPDALAWTVRAWIGGTLAATAVGLVGIAVFAVSPQTGRDLFVCTYGRLPELPVPRICPPSRNPNLLASYLAASLPLLLACGRLALPRRAQHAAAGAVGIVGLSTLSTGIGGIGLGAGVTAVGLGRRRGWPRALRRAALAGGLFVAIGFAVATVGHLVPRGEGHVPVGGRDLHLLKGTRVGTWLGAAATVRDNPVLGIGYGELVGGRPPLSRWLAGDVLDAWRDPPPRNRDAHDVWLSVAGQAGLVGLAAFLLLLGVVLRGLSPAPGPWTEPLSDLPLAVVGGLVGALLFHGLFVSAEEFRHVWALLGLGAATTAVRRASAPPLAGTGARGHPEPVSEAGTGRRGPRSGRRIGPHGAVAGVAGGAAALLVAAVVSLALPVVPFPPVAVAEALVRVTPGPVATFFIELLGHWALRLAVIGVALGFLALSALLGWALPEVARRLGGRPGVAAALLGLPPVVLAVAVLEERPGSVGRLAYAVALLPALAGGALAAARSHGRMAVGRAAPDLGRAGEAPGRPAAPPDRGVTTRREALRAGLVGGAGLLLGWSGLGRLLFPGEDPGDRPLRIRVSPASRPTPAPADAAFEDIPGLAAEVTPNRLHYVVDTAIVDPVVDEEGWALEVDGLVDRTLSIPYDELLSMPAVEQYVTLECISNEVGGSLVSTARWTGIPVAHVLEWAGIGDGAVEVVFRSVDGYSDSITLEQAMRPTSIVAVGMNGRTLPRAHGFPARLLVPGIYGMKQPKWLGRVEVVDRPYTGYWEQRGWSKGAVVKTMSRIDTPWDGEAIGGPVTIAGVAFAGTRGVERVEVSTDGGATWADAELKAALSPTAWRLWRFPFVPEPEGPWDLAARATDGEGRTQTQIVRPPHPDGASGYHEVTLRPAP
ncbi:MAG: molybdopterin-dependent oxidoreductase [Actinobacteria bacterium]|nr:molybdopterin-dependent oxidoreductase [Actinomycetota bacterium]